MGQEILKYFFILLNSVTTYIVPGIVSGLVATLFLYIVRVRYTIPDFKISDEIVEFAGKYKFKIQNLSKRALSNIKIRITFRTNSKGSPTFPNDNVPILHGKNEKGVKEEYYSMYEHEIEIEGVRLRKTNNYIGNIDKKNELEGREQTRKESVLEFLQKNEKGILEIVITYDDHHKIFGSVSRSLSKQYSGTECIKRSSRFIKGQLKTEEITGEEYVKKERRKRRRSKGKK